MKTTDWLRLKFNAARTFAQFFRYLRNWREVWDVYRSGGKPPLMLRGGITIFQEPGDDTFFLWREIFIERCYSRDGFYRPRKGDVVMDLGANVGFFALFLEWYARGIRVHCFEPAGETRRRLERNIEANGLGGLILSYPYFYSARSCPNDTFLVR